MFRFFFYQVLWSIANYLLRNPIARRVVGRGCLLLVVMWIGITVISALVVALGSAGTQISNWWSNTTNRELFIFGAVALLLMSILGVCFAVPKSRRCILRRITQARTRTQVKTIPAHSYEIDTSAQQQSGDTIDITILDESPTPASLPDSRETPDETDEDILKRIVIG